MFIGNVGPGNSYVGCSFKQYHVQAPEAVVNLLLETLSNRNLLVKKLLEKLEKEEDDEKAIEHLECIEICLHQNEQDLQLFTGNPHQ